MPVTPSVGDPSHSYSYTWLIAVGMSARSMTPRVARRKVDQSAYDRGDVSFILLSGFLVLLMIPGLAFLYSGLVRRKNALHIMFACILANAVVVITWCVPALSILTLSRTRRSHHLFVDHSLICRYVWGFSLGFSETATNGFIGSSCPCFPCIL